MLWESWIPVESFPSKRVEKYHYFRVLLHLLSWVSFLSDSTFDTYPSASFYLNAIFCSASQKNPMYCQCAPVTLESLGKNIVALLLKLAMQFWSPLIHDHFHCQKLVTSWIINHWCVFCKLAFKFTVLHSICIKFKEFWLLLPVHGNKLSSIWNLNPSVY